MSRVALPALVAVTLMLTLHPNIATVSYAGSGGGGGLALDATFIVGGQGADLASTISALRSCPGCVESNPWLKSPTQVGAGKLVVSAGVVYACHKLRQSGHKREARIIAIVFGGVGLGMAIHNLRR